MNSGTLQNRRIVYGALPFRSALPGPFQLAASLAVFACTSVIIIAIAQEKWLYALITALLSVLLFYPIEASLGLLAFLLPFDTLGAAGASSDAGSTISWYAGALAGLVLVVTGIVGRRFKHPPQAALWWGLFALWNAASLLWALNTAQGLQRLPSAVCLFLLYLAIVSFRFRAPEIRVVLCLGVVGATVAAGFAIHKFAQGGLLRAALVFGNREANPNDFASSLLLPLSLSVGAFLAAGTRLKRIATLAAAVVIVLTIFLTMSRGSLFALAVLVMVYLLRVGVRKRVLVWITLIPLLVVFLPHDFFARVQRGASDRGTGRFDIWIVAVHIIKHYPIFGTGLENFRTAYNQFAGYAPVFRRFDRDPHNVYLQVWAETGVVGLILLITAVGSQLKAVRASRSENKGTPDYLLIAVEAACWALLTHGLVANILWQKFFWMSFGFLAIFTANAARAGSIAPSDLKLHRLW